VVVIAPFLLLTPLGDTAEQHEGSQDRTIVITLLPLDGAAPSTASSSSTAASDEEEPSEAPPSARGTAKPASEPSNHSSPAAAQGEPNRIEGQASPAPTNDDVRAYQRALLAHIERYRGYPAHERSKRIEGTVLVRFAMTRQGGVIDAWVDRSSGVIALDDEAVATVRRAQPLPVIPASLPDRLSIVLPVSFIVQ
jgi:periplasmic protein TonB